MEACKRKGGNEIVVGENRKEKNLFKPGESSDKMENMWRQHSIL